MVGELNSLCALGIDTECPVCGKVFLRLDMDWGYKRWDGKKTYYFCSWKCYRKWEKKHPKRDCVGHGTYGG